MQLKIIGAMVKSLLVLVFLTFRILGMAQDTLSVDTVSRGYHCYSLREEFMFSYYPLDNKVKEKYDVFVFKNDNDREAYIFSSLLDSNGNFIDENLSFIEGGVFCDSVEYAVYLTFEKGELESVAVGQNDTLKPSLQKSEVEMRIDSLIVDKTKETNIEARVEHVFLEGNTLYHIEYDKEGRIRKRGFYLYDTQSLTFKKCFYWLYYSETGELEYSVAYPTTMGIEK